MKSFNLQEWTSRELEGHGHTHLWPSGEKEYCADPYCTTHILHQHASVEKVSGRVFFFDGKTWEYAGFCAE